jgi:hypothetical protein
MVAKTSRTPVDQLTPRPLSEEPESIKTATEPCHELLSGREESTFISRAHCVWYDAFLTLGINVEEGAPTVSYMKFNVMYPELLGRVRLTEPCHELLSGREESTFISRAHCVWFCASVLSVARSPSLSTRAPRR